MSRTPSGSRPPMPAGQPPHEDDSWGTGPDAGDTRTTDSPLVRFARAYGWRAYAIPVLAVITVWLLVDVVFGTTETTAESASDSSTEVSTTAEELEDAHADDSGSRGPGPDPAHQPEEPNTPFELPPGGPFTVAGDGTFRIVGQPGMQVGEGEEGVIRYVVEVENGLNTDTYGGDDGVAAMVDATLSDPRGWTNDPRFRFEHVAPDEDPNLRIRISSPTTTAELCGRYLEMETSCRTTITGESTVFMNEARWVRGADPFQGDLGSYRQYLINHEVGHALGYRSHMECGGEGELAPVMMQQTISLNNSELLEVAPYEIYPDDGVTCRYNPWPYPIPGTSPSDDGAPGAPEEGIN